MPPGHAERRSAAERLRNCLTVQCRRVRMAELSALSLDGGSKLRRRRIAIAAALAFFSLCAPVRAESLEDALASAYLDNIELNAARAQLRATDETVPLAVAAFRPVISGSANAGRSWQRE